MSRGHPWWMPALGLLSTGAFAALASTWRMRYQGLTEYDARFAAGQPHIFAFWHARLLALVYSHRRRGVVVLTSRHQDGEIIARVLAGFGYGNARGSSTRGGDAGVREMLTFAEAGRSLAITPDGPRGPAERVKAGLVYLASRTGFPILPVASAASREWRLRSWDGFRVPRPFARVVVAHGEPFVIPRTLEDADVESWCRRIEASIHEVTNRADAMVREGR
jgi:lysophospholipid acyltransferase (LPLAT)-like uncharacterized protein